MKQKGVAWRLAGVGVALMIGLAGCGGTETATQTTAPVTNPEQLFKQSCISCHGAQLQGASGPNLQKVGQRLDAAAIENIIRNGKGGMPSMSRGLNDAQIASLSSWLADKK
jgi:cytochrome c551